MDKRFDKLEEKLDGISADISEIKIVQAEQAKDLKYHIRRSDLNEDRIELIETKLIPLIEIKNKFEGVFKFIGIIGTGLGLVFGAVKAVEAILNLLV